MVDSEAVKITIKDGGPGWADYVLAIGSKTFVMEGASYCSDALGDLLRAALQIAAGGREATCGFDREPQEWRLHLQRDVDSRRLFVGVLEFPDFQGNAPIEAGEECFRSECDAREFTLAVEDAARAVFSDKGDVGYREWWNMPFPEGALAALRAAHEMPAMGA